MKKWSRLGIGTIAVFSSALLVMGALQTAAPGQAGANGASAGFGDQTRGTIGTMTPDYGTPAPAGFDNKTNGVLSQAEFDASRAVFEEKEEIADGLGPVYNAAACVDCHANPVTGSGSQIGELRAGLLYNGQFSNPPGGSLIQDRAIHADIQERIDANYDVRTVRMSLSTLGDGFVEAIAESTLVAISNNQPSAMRGQVIRVPVLEAGGTLRVGRFGWKNQHASLESFSADAYLNEMGITSPLQRVENTSNGRPIHDYDRVPDPEDDGADVRLFAMFMRATKVPPRDEALAATADAQAGAQIFNKIGCDNCHVRTIVTAPTGTMINGGAFAVPPALGAKTIHPFGDFLLHDVNTGDGIVQNGGPYTRNKVRTAPLWGLRTRTRLMHDGFSLTISGAILRHGGEAAGPVIIYRFLSNTEQKQVLTFLSSL